MTRECKALIKVAKEAAECLTDELMAAGPKEAKEHPVLRRHSSVLTRLQRAIALAEGKA